MRHLRVKRTNVAHRLPRGKRASETEINHFQEQQSLRKQPFITNSFYIPFLREGEVVFLLNLRCSDYQELAIY
ncbi:hypothetical protein QUF49_14210 [Fictibacillus sp. b24]|uniref:hypothetical protein n=1 Tax=Fictibacillus sp. b24 TaxID=3055863 RepID=UPI0025A29BDE|nr:hypothetical protein [Fictibacillus sp. b24]MDM5317158.1 hypothetical protein [Fictibacillus sp. b24]